MPRIPVDLTKARMQTRVFDKGDIRAMVTRTTGFAGTSAKGPYQGIRYGLKVAEGEENAGETMQDISLFIRDLNDPNAYGRAKRFVGACLGYNADQDDAFNADVAGANEWWIDTDDPQNVAVADGWRLAEGNEVIVSVDVREDDQGNRNQDYRNFMPARQ